MWSSLCQFIAELLRLFLIRGYETVKYLYHQGYRDGRKQIPPLKHEFLQYSATRLVRMIQDKEVGRLEHHLRKESWGDFVSEHPIDEQ